MEIISERIILVVGSRENRLSVNCFAYVTGLSLTKEIGGSLTVTNLHSRTNLILTNPVFDDTDKRNLIDVLETLSQFSS